LRTKEQGTHLTLNEHDDDDDIYVYIYIYVYVYITPIPQLSKISKAYHYFIKNIQLEKRIASRKSLTH